jgi:hypothetical protein
MSPGAVGYERGTELNEGLAQYVEYKSINRPAALTKEDFPAEEIRKRGYATGQAFALLLDRTGIAWKDKIDGVGSLDELLTQSLRGCEMWPPVDLPQAKNDAKREVANLVATRAKRRQDFLSAPGWRMEIVAGKEPLWPQGFDPWNVQNVSTQPGDYDILHTRWVKLGNGSGAIEVLNHPSLTMGVGPHPLFNGAKRLIVTGLREPKVTEAGGKVTIAAEGAKGTFTGTVKRDGQTIVVRLP